MAEIYKIQTQSSGTMLPEQDRVQLQNDAGRYLQAAAQDLSRVGQIIDDRSNREATNRMTVAKENIDNFIKTYNDFSDGYMERMTTIAQQMWDEAYNGLSRNQRVMFERNNPASTEIMKLGIAREVGDVALRHEVDEAKVRNDVTAVQIALDDNGRLKSPQEIMEGLEYQLNDIQNNPGLKDFPDQRSIIEKDLGSKTIKGALDLALSVGNTTSAKNLLYHENSKSFLSPSEIAQYTSRIISYEESAAKEAKENGSTVAKVSEAKEKITWLYDGLMRSADRSGVDRQVAEDAFYYITSQIKNGTPANQLVASPAFVSLQKMVNQDPNADPNMKKMFNIIGKKGLTLNDIFGGDNIYALQVGATDAAATIAQTTNAYTRGYVAQAMSDLDNSVNDIINAHVDEDDRNKAKQPSSSLDILLTRSEHDDLEKAVAAVEVNETALSAEQVKQLNRSRALLARYLDDCERTLGLIQSGSHADLWSSVYRGSGFFDLFKKNFFSGNLTPKTAIDAMANKQPYPIGAAAYSALANSSSSESLQQDIVDESWDAMVATTTNVTMDKEPPKVGTYGYLIDATVSAMYNVANYRDYGTEKPHNIATVLGAQGKTFDGKKFMKLLSDLETQFNVTDSYSAGIMVNDDPTAPIEQTQAYAVLKYAIEKSGFVLTDEDGAEAREGAIRNMADSLRSAMRPRSGTSLSELSKKQRKMLQDRRQSEISVSGALAARNKKVGTTNQ